LHATRKLREKRVDLQRHYRYKVGKRKEWKSYLLGGGRMRIQIWSYSLQINSHPHSPLWTFKGWRNFGT